ncbi:hypothetical protein [Xanthobacter flavus]|uniref:hypothetical protein n=1 Tax=Xanthobacter flavus TaxID=281 RepID=UPI00372940A1
MEPRSFVGRSPWAFQTDRTTISSQTAISDRAPFLVGPDRAEDSAVAQLAEYKSLTEGWDGEHAAKPSLEAIYDAQRFVRALGAVATTLEPTPHVDGSILLEIDDGASGSLRFAGDGLVIYAIVGKGRGVAEFDGFTVPEAIRRAIGA